MAKRPEDRFDSAQAALIAIREQLGAIGADLEGEAMAALAEREAIGAGAEENAKRAGAEEQQSRATRVDDTDAAPTR